VISSIIWAKDVGTIARGRAQAHLSDGLRPPFDLLFAQWKSDPKMYVRGRAISDSVGWNIKHSPNQLVERIRDAVADIGFDVDSHSWYGYRLADLLSEEYKDASE